MIRVAFHRFEEAHFLYDKGNFTTGAIYLGGYSVECALKSLILATDTPRTDPSGTFADFIKVGAKSHSYDYLIHLLLDR